MMVVFIVCISCHSFRTKNKLESHKIVCENKDFCSVGMPCEENMMLQFNRYLTSAKVPSVLYADLESLIKKVYGCENNPEKLFTTKVAEYFIRVFSFYDTII